MKAIGGAFVTGTYWFFAAAIIALFIEAFIDPNGEIADVWPAVLGYPAFAGGLTFFTLLRMFEGRRRFEEIPLLRAAVWGALSTIAVPALLFLVAGGGDPNPRYNSIGLPVEPGWLTGAVLVAATLSFALAGWTTVKMARQMAAGIAERKA